MFTYRKFDHLEVIGCTNLDFASCTDTIKSTFDYVSFSWRSDSMKKCEAVSHYCIHHGG